MVSAADGAEGIFVTCRLDAAGVEECRRIAVPGVIKITQTVGPSLTLELLAVETRAS